MIRQVLSNISNQYISNKGLDFKNNSMVRYLESECKQDFINSGIVDPKQYIVEGSAGKGNWAAVPWICIFDKDISVSARKGYYIVYLFTADMSGVYISLGQGWTYYKDTFGRKEGYKRIAQIADYWRVILKSCLGHFSKDPINLKAEGFKTDLPKGYERGHIFGKYYNANNLPAEDELVRDLQIMITLFRELKGNLIGDYIDTNNFLFRTRSINEIDKPDSMGAKIDKIITNMGKDTHINAQSVLPDIYNESGFTRASITTGSNGRQTDYEENSKKHRRLGLAGEYMVLNQLIKDGYEVEHVAVTKNDREGYDIKACKDDQELHIEVKTTTGGINVPFYLTSKEIEHSNHYADIYYLYRIYNFDGEKGDLFVLTGDVTKVLKLEAQSFISKGLLLKEEVK
jgi:hypothetical protein